MTSIPLSARPFALWMYYYESFMTGFVITLLSGITLSTLSSPEIILSALSMGFIFISAFMFNDIIDRDLDFNSGKHWKFTYKNPKDVRILLRSSIFLCTVSLLITAIIGLFQFVIASISVSMVVLYSKFFKNTKIVDMISNFCLGTAPLLMVGYVGPILLLFGFTSLLVFINGGIVDRDKDAIYGIKNTFTSINLNKNLKIQKTISLMILLSAIFIITYYAAFSTFRYTYFTYFIFSVYLILSALSVLLLSYVNKSLIERPLKIRWMELYSIVGLIRLFTLFPIGIIIT
ncbi:MAG: hypothetical protein EF806_02720 [Candidatus Methanoliparum thermophilum]|uniref:Prenyltransferase n=1 Tax=Methanoliparum thermophilum TaxID=2491083 RepID=A0A520KSV4_METT2|nr:UbiA family prenyltransferase [Candidatus Methanoliparum sp. LAM-1]RZN64974.1 MAG: hypothetical protein EF806_02720 [Candidatus Methanoliparum thermophilum]BDC36143.1 hypothetical protein MTLP_08250 [Candidatus Methanoliparum sp. LAM-1]